MLQNKAKISAAATSTHISTAESFDPIIAFPLADKSQMFEGLVYHVAFFGYLEEF